MPKDEKQSLSSDTAKAEPKKKMVVVEEVVEEINEPITPITVDEPKVEELQIKTDITSNDEEFEKSNYLWIIIPTALLIGVLVGGLITYFSGLSKLNQASSTPTPVASIEPTTEPTPTASPSSTLNREELKVQVLNGSGVSGLAGKAKTYLEGLGYKNIAVGNAAVSNLVETTVSMKDSKKELFNQIVADLSKNYKVSDKLEILPSTSKYDLVITLGSK